MGDRGNIVCLYGDDEKTEIWFYTHWMGSALPQILARALDRGRERWEDPSYLARIIFSQMLMDSGQLEDLTGFGIGPSMCDENNPPLWVDLEKKTVNGKSYEKFIAFYLSDEPEEKEA